MSVLSVKPKLLYPRSRQFPFDEVAEKIVKALEKRNWKVPGITVEFHTYGSGEAKYKMVEYIKGKNFRLHFSRSQGSLNNYLNDIAALYKVHIPMQSIAVYDDESGPTYCLYVGKDWERDKDWFMNSIKVHSKLNKEPRKYLKYSGNMYRGRKKELVYDNDLGREYSPVGDEPQRINLEEKFKEFTSWLEKFVLEYILKFPEQEAEEEPAVEIVQYSGLWPVVFSLCNGREVERILKGKKNPNELLLEDRHAYFGTGHRLVPLGARGEGLPEIAHEGFIWCDTNQNITPDYEKEEISSGVYSAMSTLSYGNYIIAVALKYANDVYVADNTKFDETRYQLFESIAPRKRLTNDELNQAYVARGKTIVPINEYNGDYKEPIVLINRELDFSEIEWIAYPK